MGASGLEVAMQRVRGPAPDGEWGLVGRDPELARIAQVLEDRSRRGVLIRGPAGMGKTSLAREVLQAAAHRGCHTEWITAIESAALLPFGAVLALLPPPTLDTLRATRPETAPVELIAAALRSRAGRRPVVLAVDDVHLLDEGAAAIIHYLAVSKQVAVVMTARESVAVPEGVASLWKDDLVERVEISSLSERDVARLVSATLGGPLSCDAGHRLWRMSEGNPLLLREIVHQSIVDGRFAFSGVLWHWHGLTTTGPRLHDRLAARLRSISSQGRYVLQLVSFGQPLRQEVLCRLASEEEVAALIADGMIVEDVEDHQPVYRVRHALDSELVKSQMSRLEARTVMHKLAVATTEIGNLGRDEQFRLAGWWLETGHPGQPEVFVAAATHALYVGDSETAAKLARAALAHGDSFEAMVLLAEASRSTPDSPGPWTRFAQARDLMVGDRQATRWAMAVLRSLPCRAIPTDDALAAAERVIANLSDPVLQDLIRGQMAVSWAILGRTNESVALASPLLISKHELVRINALFAGGAPAILGGKAAGIARLAEELLTSSRDVERELPGAHNLVRTAHLGARLALGHFAEIEAFLAEFDRADPDNQAADFSRFTTVLAGVVALMIGKVRTAADQLRDGYDACRESGSMHLGWTAGLLIQALAISGDLAGAEHVMDETRDLPPVEPYDADRARASAWIMVARGELKQARAQLIEAADRTHEQGRYFIELTTLHDALRLGANQVAKRMTQIASLVDGPWADACGVHAEGVVAGDGGRIEQAAQRFEDLGLLLPASEICSQAATAFLAAGQPAAARRLEARAAILLAQCEGASTPLTRFRPVAQPLTDRERQVATMAGNSYTSREIAATLSLSVRTIENVLQRAYRKLGVRGRAELVGVLGQPTPDRSHIRA